MTLPADVGNVRVELSIILGKEFTIPLPTEDIAQVSLAKFRKVLSDALDSYTGSDNLSPRERARLLSLPVGTYSSIWWHHKGFKHPVSAAGIYDPDDPKFDGVEYPRVTDYIDQALRVFREPGHAQLLEVVCAWYSSRSTTSGKRIAVRPYAADGSVTLDVDCGVRRVLARNEARKLRDGLTELID